MRCASRKNKKPTSGASAPNSDQIQRSIRIANLRASLQGALQLVEKLFPSGGGATPAAAPDSSVAGLFVGGPLMTKDGAVNSLAAAAPAPPAARKPRRGRKRASGTMHKHAPCGIVGCAYCRPELRRSGKS